jgi:hypothetical protein
VGRAGLMPAEELGFAERAPLQYNTEPAAD